MSLERYQQNMQDIQKEISFWVQRPAEAIPLPTLKKIIKQLDTFNRKPLPLSEFHTVKALYEEANVLAGKLNSHPPSEKHVPSIQKLLARVSDITNVDSVEKVDATKSSNIKTIACLSALDSLPPSEKEQAQKIAQKITVPTIKKKVIRALKTSSKQTVTIGDLIFSAKKPFRDEKGFFSFSSENSTSLKKRSYRPITGYFNPASSLAGNIVRTSLKAQRTSETRILDSKRYEFVPLTRYSLQKNKQNFLLIYRENKETFMKKFLILMGADPLLTPILAKHCSPQNPPLHIKKIEHLLLEYRKSVAVDEKIAALLLQRPEIFCFLQEIDLLDSPTKAALGLNIYLGKEKALSNSFSSKEKEKYLCCAALGGNRIFLENHLPKNPKNLDSLCIYAAFGNRKEILELLIKKYPALQKHPEFPFAQYAALGGHQKLTEYLIDHYTPSPKAETVLKTLFYAAQSGEETLYKTLRKKYWNPEYRYEKMEMLIPSNLIPTNTENLETFFKENRL